MRRLHPRMRPITVGALSAMCMLAGCSTPTTVRVDFSTQGNVVLDTLTVQIGLGSAPLDAPKSLAASGSTAGSFLIPLRSSAASPVTVALSGTTAAGEPVTATGSVPSSMHAEAELDLLLTCGIFCDDFDDRTSVQGAWSLAPVPTGSGSAAEVSISSAEYVSAPHSLAFHAPAYADANVDGEGVTLPVTFVVNNASVSVDFDVMTKGYTGGTGTVNLMFLHLGSLQVGGLDLESTGPAFYTIVYAADGGFSNPPPYPTPPAADGTWHHVHYAEVFDEQAGSLNITWDGAVVVNRTDSQTWADGAVPTNATLFLDNRARGQTSAVDIYFDNVRIR